MNTKNERVLEVIKTAIVKAGSVIKEVGSSKAVKEKLNAKDLVTEYDKKTQTYLEDELKANFPEIKFLAEEDADLKTTGVYHGEYFIIDPIDGTSNFVNNLNMSSISIGYTVDGEVQVGVVHNPFLDETFYAIRGKGAYLNGKPIHVNGNKISEGLVGFGTAVYYDELVPFTVSLFEGILPKVNDLRRLGSAALDLCYVAAGRFTAFFETRLCPWDYSAAMLIVQEAGGKITDFDGNRLALNKKPSVIAGNVG